MSLTFSGPLWHWRGPAPWYFVTVPPEGCETLKAASSLVTYGWGMIPVQVGLGETLWTTSLFPQEGRYLVPIKASVRRAEGLEEGDTVTLRLEVRSGQRPRKTPDEAEAF
ncbi:DUF1905 domain-containing protein [Deinococcus sp. YIM 134068]|uniref:DUF1905 domain-containing protein n=1 Tax=Deinococcus lichenicola TaxID=3118910 RepID=UPI002F94E826